MLKKPRVIGQRRMLRAYPKLKHGVKRTSLETLRKKLDRRGAGQDRGNQEKAQRVVADLLQLSAMTRFFIGFFAAYSVHFCALKIAGSYFQIAHLMLYCYIRV